MACLCRQAAVTPLCHLLLERVQLIRKVDDALRARRPLYQVTEPLLRLHHLIIRPHEARLVGRGRARVWTESAGLVASLIHGPHLGDLARSWCIDHASAETLGGLPSRCEPALIPCREHKTSHELDVVVSKEVPHAATRVLAIGEVKAVRSPVGLNQLRRLEHIRPMLPGGTDSGSPRLLLFARHGFTRELVVEADARSDVELIDLQRLYRGS
jgi:uncharacterized protein